MFSKSLNWLRAIAPILLVLILVSVMVFLGMISLAGLSPTWRDKLEEELSQRGLHCNINSVRIDFKQGLIARDVVFYANADKTGIPLASLNRFSCDVAFGQLVKGSVDLNSIQFSGAELNIPLTSSDPNSKIVQLSDFQGRIDFDSNRSRLRQLRGEILGIPFSINGDLVNMPDEFTHTKSDDTESQLPEKIIDYVESLSWPPNSPPELEINCANLTPNLAQGSLEIKIALPSVERKLQRLTDGLVHARVSNGILSIDSFEFSGIKGSFSSSATLVTRRQQLDFKVDSSVHLPELLEAFAGFSLPAQIQLYGRPILEAQGTLNFSDDWESITNTRLLGTLDARYLEFNTLPLDRLVGQFSLQGKKLFLPRLRIEHQGCLLAATLMIDEEFAKFEAKGEVNPAFVRPLLGSAPLGKIIDQTDFPNGRKTRLNARGWLPLASPNDLHIEGNLRSVNFVHREVPIKAATSQFALRPGYIDFTNAEVIHDYRNHPHAKKHGFDKFPGRVRGDAIHILWHEKIVELKGIRGEAYPFITTKLFDSRLAEHLTRYDFEKPPLVELEGQIDTSRERRGEFNDLTIDFASDGPANYRFLGAIVPLQSPSGTVKITQNLVELPSIAAQTLGGEIRGKLSFDTRRPDATDYQGSLKFDAIQLPDICSTWKFNQQPPGEIFGRIEFKGASDRPKSLTGNGNLAVYNGNLLRTPLLGPLSPVVSNILGDKRAGYNEINTGSCRFILRDGFWETNSLVATSPMLTLTGVGKINLTSNEIDMDVRMNARGLLGLVTLPLAPFNGLFQFNGSGPLSDVNWRATPFSPPPAGEDDPIFKRPNRAQVIRPSQPSATTPPPQPTTPQIPSRRR